MKIIQLIQMPQLRGAELFACQLSNHLIKNGHEVLVICIFKGEANLPFTGEIIYLDRPLNSRFTDFVGWKKFNKIIRNFKPDIIQANAADTLKFAASSKFFFKFNTPIVLRNANKAGDFIDSTLKRQLNLFYLNKISFVISVSDECKKDFIKTFKFPKSKISTIKIGVEDKKIGSVPNDLKDIFEKNIIITHIGSFVPEKNHKALLREFKIVHKSKPFAHLLLIGKGSLEKEIKKLVKESNFEKNVHFLGYRDDVMEILANSDVFVLPSLIEGLPGVILEAMFCKTPVVAYNVGGISEILNSGTGTLIEKHDESGFAEAVIKVISAPNPKQINNAHNLVLTEFLNEQITQKFLNQYNKIISH